MLECEKEESRDKNNYLRCACLNIVICILSALFTFVFGLIIGAAASTVILAAIAAIIVLALILLIMLIITIVLLKCCKRC